MILSVFLPRARGDTEWPCHSLPCPSCSTPSARAIGAIRYERTDERTTHRNGSRGRLLSTKAGDVELRIPKFRAGSLFPAILEPRRRIDRALWAVVMEAYVQGSARARSTTSWPPWGSMPGSARAR